MEDILKGFEITGFHERVNVNNTRFVNVNREIKNGEKMKKKGAIYLTEEEQEKLINIFNTRYFNSQRNKLIVICFLNLGITLKELINLKWGDVGLKSKVKKNEKNYRFIDLNKNNKVFHMVLVEWKDKQLRELGSCKYIFTTRTKQQLDERYIRQMLTTYSRKAGIQKDVNPKMLRDTYASNLLKMNPDNIDEIKELMGYKSMEGIKKYLEKFNIDIKKQFTFY